MTPPKIDEAKAAAHLMEQVAQQVESVLQGKAQAIRHALIALLGGGHLLVEDLPGVGKTTLAQALAKSLGLNSARIQFTSDLLPSDLIGAQIFDPKSASFTFRPGPVFRNIVLADEINRAPPRTQSALLEAMSECQVSIDGTCHPLPRPFAVIATQNPTEQSGTYPLPDSQLDRFIMRISVGHPSASVEKNLLINRCAHETSSSNLKAALDHSQLSAILTWVQAIQFEDSVADYAVRLVQATRETKLLSVGASTRGLLALASAARASALLDGRTFTIPDDVKHLAVPVLAHRVRVAKGLSPSSVVARAEAEQIIAAIVDRCEVPA